MDLLDMYTCLNIIIKYICSLARKVLEIHLRPSGPRNGNCVRRRLSMLQFMNHQCPVRGPPSAEEACPVALDTRSKADGSEHPHYVPLSLLVLSPYVVTEGTSRVQCSLTCSNDSLAGIVSTLMYQLACIAAISHCSLAGCEPCNMSTIGYHHQPSSCFPTNMNTGTQSARSRSARGATDHVHQSPVTEGDIPKVCISFLP